MKTALWFRLRLRRLRSSENWVVVVTSGSGRTKLITKRGKVHCAWFILPLLLPTATICFSLDCKLRLHFYIRKLSFALHIDTIRHKLSKHTSSTSAWIPANSGLVKFSQNLGLFKSNTFNISERTKKMVKPVLKKIHWIHWREEIQVLKFINSILINYDLLLIVVSWQLFGIINTSFSDCCKQLIKLLTGPGQYKIN